MTSNRSLVGAITLIAVTAMLALGAASASADDDHGKKKSALVGSWLVTLDRGPALPPLKSLQTFTRGHSVVEIANAGATVRSPSHGAWEHVDGPLYAMTIVFFRYDPQTGAYLGTHKIRSTIRVAPDGQSFTAVAVSELRDADGNLVPANIRSTGVGERINVERIPDQP